MAYELGTYSEELRAEHMQGGRRGKQLDHLDCPLCSKEVDEAEGEGLDPLGEFFAELEQATEGHEGHSPAVHYTECHKCMAKFGKSRQ